MVLQGEELAFKKSPHKDKHLNREMPVYMLLLLVSYFPSLGYSNTRGGKFCVK